MQPIKLLMARTSELWWDGLLKLLETENDIQVVGVCSTAMETVDLASNEKPDVILFDEEISPGESGELLHRITDLDEETKDTKIIMIIKPYKDVQLAAIFKANARAYIDKDISYKELMATIRQVAQGGVVVISRVVAKGLLKNIDSFGKWHTEKRPEYNVGLSKREEEVLRLLAKKSLITNKEIGETLFISENTVKVHLSSILEKMNVRNREQAVNMAQEMGLIDKST